MKNYLIAIFLLLGIYANAQASAKFKTVEISDSIRVGGKWHKSFPYIIDTIITVGSSSSTSDIIIPSTANSINSINVLGVNGSGYLGFDFTGGNIIIHYSMRPATNTTIHYKFTAR